MQQNIVHDRKELNVENQHVVFTIYLMFIKSNVITTNSMYLNIYPYLFSSLLWYRCFLLFVVLFHSVWCIFLLQVYPLVVFSLKSWRKKISTGRTQTFESKKNEEALRKAQVYSSLQPLNASSFFCWCQGSQYSTPEHPCCYLEANCDWESKQSNCGNFLNSFSPLL